MYGETRIVPARQLPKPGFLIPSWAIVGVCLTRHTLDLYGLGFDLKDYAGKLIVSHTGAVTGFLSSVTLVPEDTLGISYFNKFHPEYNFLPA